MITCFMDCTKQNCIQANKTTLPSLLVTYTKPNKHTRWISKDTESQQNLISSSISSKHHITVSHKPKKKKGKLKLLLKGQDSMPKKSRLLFVSIKLSPRVCGFSVDCCLFAGFLDKMQIYVRQPHPISLICICFAWHQEAQTCLQQSVISHFLNKLHLHNMWRKEKDKYVTI